MWGVTYGVLVAIVCVAGVDYFIYPQSSQTLKTNKGRYKISSVGHITISVIVLLYLISIVLWNSYSQISRDISVCCIAIAFLHFIGSLLLRSVRRSEARKNKISEKLLKTEQLMIQEVISFDNTKVVERVQIDYKDNGKQKKPTILILPTNHCLDFHGNKLFDRMEYPHMNSNLYEGQVENFLPLDDFTNIIVENDFLVVRLEFHAKAHSETITSFFHDMNTVWNTLGENEFVDSGGIYLCGIGYQGTMEATLICNKYDFKGLILLAGGGNTLKESMIYEMNYLKKRLAVPKKIYQSVLATYSSMENAERILGGYRGELWQVESEELLHEIHSFKNKKLLLYAEYDSHCSTEKYEYMISLDFPNLQVELLKDINDSLRKEIKSKTLYLNYKHIVNKNVKIVVDKQTVNKILKWLYSNINLFKTS